MTITDGDIQERQPGSGNDAASEPEEGFNNARARDGQRTSFGNALPDTERVREAAGDWLRSVGDGFQQVFNGSFWDEQPPSPRELIDRYRESSWTHSEYRLLAHLRIVGCVISIVWSLPLYGLAILGQRFGRAVIASLFIYLLIHWI